MLGRLAPLLGSSQWCSVAAAAQHALHTSVAAAQAEAAVAQQSNVQDALNALRKRMAQGKHRQQQYDSSSSSSNPSACLVHYGTVCLEPALALTHSSNAMCVSLFQVLSLVTL
jgi:hypothetical protein